jgi:hypothetical protein
VTYQLTTAAGNVVAPNGQRYGAAAATVVLSDAEYAQLSASAAANDFTGSTYLGDQVTYQCTLKSTVSNVVLPNQLRYGASAVAILSDAEYAQLSPTAISGLFSSVTTVSGGGGGISPPAGDIGGSTSSPTVVSTHLASPLPVAQGGTGAASAAQNAFLAGPSSGGAGAPAFRALATADVPTLNQDTTGTAAGLSSVLALASGGTGYNAASSSALLSHLGITFPAASVNFKPPNPASTASQTSGVMSGLGSTVAYTPTGTGIVQVTLTGEAGIQTAITGVVLYPRYGTGTAPYGSLAATVASGAGSAAQFTVAGTAYALNTQVVLTATSAPGNFTSNSTYYVVNPSGTTFYLATTASGTAIAYSSAGTGVVIAPLVTGTRFGTATDPTVRPSSFSSSNALLPFSFTDRLALAASTAYWFDVGIATNASADVAMIQNISITLQELIA